MGAQLLRVSAAAAAILLTCATPALGAARDFPRDFLWGTAIAAFQTEAGGTPSNADTGSDWWVWSGYYPRFGFFSYDPDTRARSERPSARLFRRIARSGRLPG